MEYVQGNGRQIMMRRILWILNYVAGLFFKLKRGVAVGENSRVTWARIRLPRGSRISIGKNSLVHCRISFDSNQGHVIIGDRSYVGLSSLVCYRKIEIGNDVLIAWGVTIVDHNSHSLYWEQRKDDVRDWSAGIKYWDNVGNAPVIIKDKVWIGFNVSILKGVTIGEGAVIGACAVVTKDIPPFTLVAGNPAAVVRVLNETKDSP